MIGELVVEVVIKEGERNQNQEEGAQEGLEGVLLGRTGQPCQGRYEEQQNATYPNGLLALEVLYINLGIGSAIVDCKYVPVSEYMSSETGHTAAGK